MARRSAGLTLLTACAQVARAFLIPDNFELATSNAQSLSPLESTAAAHKLLLLPCLGCFFRSTTETVEGVEESENLRDNLRDNPIFHLGGDVNSIAVNFSISDDGRALEVNGEAIYPLGFQVEDIFRTPKTYVHQVSPAASVDDVQKGKTDAIPVEVTSHGVSVMGETAISDSGDALVPIRYSIFELNRQLVTVDDVFVHIFKQASGDLYIMHVETKPAPSPFGAPQIFEADLPLPEEHQVIEPPLHHVEHFEPSIVPEEECKMLSPSICKLRNMLKAKLMGARKGGCAGRKSRQGRPHMEQIPDHIRPHFLRPDHDGPSHGRHHHGRPHHMRPHRHNHHRHHDQYAYHFVRAFSRGLTAVMIPTMAGVAVGMAVSLIGLLLGRVIGFVWTVLFRGGRPGCGRIALDDTDRSQLRADKIAHDYDEEEKLVGSSEISDDTEALPVYEEAPTYEEATKNAEQ